MLELHSPAGAFEQIESYLRERGFFAPGGEELAADLYLGYGLSEPLRRTASPGPPEPCPLPLAAVAVRDTTGSDPGHVGIGQWRRSWSDAEYIEAVEAVRAAIGRGDVYQVNLVQHLAASFEGNVEALADRLGVVPASAAGRRRLGDRVRLAGALPRPQGPPSLDGPDQGNAPAR